MCWFSIPLLGASRGFAFVEFVRIEDAKAWMATKQVDRHGREPAGGGGLYFAKRKDGAAWKGAQD